jgi:UDP-N-acetyl-D-mannosaminuronic acid dehydrogenase
LPSNAADLCVVGLGTVGLPLAVWFAAHGMRVHGVDRDRDRAMRIRRGSTESREPGLRDRLLEVVADARLTASAEAVDARAYILTVPTPVDADHAVVLDALEDALDAIVPRLAEDALVVIASTVPVGTTDRIASRVRAARADLARIHVAHAPERVLPGAVLEELATSPRVIGGVDPASTRAATALYARTRGGEIASVDARTAEMVKLAENAQRDVAVAFADELSMMAERAKVDVREVVRVANRHPRVHILEPGPGAGGPCLPKDAWMLASLGEGAGLVTAARDVAARKIEHVVTRALTLCASRTIGCLGIAYKADVDDTRGSTALAVVEELKRRHPATVLVCDPVVAPGGIDVSELLATDAMLVALVRHRVFVARRDALRARIVLDVCGLAS